MAFVSALPVASRPAPTRRICTRPVRMDLSTTTHLAANPAALDALASAFGTLGMPAAVVKWGHPAMMAVMVAGMGGGGAAIGWAGRLNGDKKEGLAQKQTHENVMLAFVLLAALGGFGGTLSVAMQGFDVWESPHFLSAVVVLGALAANGVFAWTGFAAGGDGSPKARLAGRKVHAWFGVATMAAFLVHGYLGFVLSQ